MNMQDTAGQILLALEQRLQRLTFLLHGDPLDKVNSAEPLPSEASIASRLHNLERSLRSVAVQSTSAAELLRLQKNTPDLWDGPTNRTEDTGHVPDPALTALVLAHMPSYHTTAAQLTSLNDLPLPDASSAANLLSLQPRIQRAIERQEQQARMISEMRQVSVALIGRWYELGIVSMGDCWNEWEARLMETERTVRQAEGRKRRAEEDV